MACPFLKKAGLQLHHFSRSNNDDKKPVSVIFYSRNKWRIKVTIPKQQYNIKNENI